MAHWLVFLAQVLVIGALAVRSSHLAVAADEEDPPSRVARLSYLGGAVSFQPAGESEWVMAIANRPLTAGDRLWTDAGARAELNTGSATIRLDASTDFSFLNLDDRTVQMQLTQGTATVRVQRLRKDELVEVDTPNQAFSILEPGSYRIEASDDGSSTLVTVRAGEGEASGGGETYTVRSGETTRFTGSDPLDATLLRTSRFDELERWGQGRDRRLEESRSARYVARDVVGYEDLDDNGTWRTVPGYGNVWTPTRVAQGWAPYHDGHWAWISPWGYTWVDDAPWGYAPFHYGRWVTVHGRWGWVPGPTAVEAVYAPALVAFIGGPSYGLSRSADRGGAGGEVAWFPLGPREVYVPGYHVSRGYVNRVNVSNTTVDSTTITNVYNTQVNSGYRTTNIRYVNRAAPGGVTVVPRQAFTGAQPVARAAVTVDARRLAAAPVGPTAAAAPTRNAVFGASGPRAEGAPRPPAAVAGRSVVAKAPPPSPPVPFARQQHALEAHPGQPLARKEVEGARPPAAAAAQPLVRQAPPGKPAVAREDRTSNTPQGRSPQDGNDKGARAGSPASAPGASGASSKPAGEPASPGLEPRVAQQPERPKPGEPAAKPQEPPRPAEQAAKRPEPPKPEEQAARPPEPPRPAGQAAKRPEPPKPAEQAAKPPGLPKPAEQAAKPREPPKPAEQAAKRQEPPKAAEQAAKPPEPPKAAARAAQQSDRPATPSAGAAPRSKAPPDKKEKRDGQDPDEERKSR